MRIHANILGDEAEAGRPGGAVLRRLLERAREQLGPQAAREECLLRAAHGLVFVDEVDKIRSHVGDQPNVRGIRAQEALLTLIENEAVPLDLPEWMGGGTVTVDSSALLFVCAGAFEGLYDAVFDRVTIGADKGALQPVTVVEGGRVTREARLPPARLAAQRGPVRLRHEPAVPLPLRRRGAARGPGRGGAGAHLPRDAGVGLPPDPRLLREPRREARHLAQRGRGGSPRAAARQPRLGARALKEVFRRVVRDLELEPEKEAREGVLLIDHHRVDKALEAP